MTATTNTRTVVSDNDRSSYARIPSAFKLQFVVPATLIWVPILVFAAAWGITVLIGLWVDGIAETRVAAEDRVYTGASQAAVWCLVFMAAYAASHTFPFSMALSYSRRVFILGAFLAFGVVSLVYGAAFALVAALERATNGYGVHFYIFDLPYLTESSGILAAGAFAALLCLLLMMVGFFWSILYRRVTVAVLWAVLLAVVVALAVAVLLITQNGGWDTVWQWFTEQTALSLTAWLVVPTIGMALLNYAVIRKATPTP